MNNQRHAYIIVKLLEHGIQNIPCKIAMDCGIFHVTCDMTFLLSTGKSECQ